MNTQVLRQKKLEILTALYFSSSPRDCSPQRFIKRLLKPRKHRHQSLLRGAQRAASFVRMGHVEDCTPRKCGAACKRAERLK